jgi:hypothetical protein
LQIDAIGMIGQTRGDEVILLKYEAAHVDKVGNSHHSYLLPG